MRASSPSRSEPPPRRYQRDPKLRRIVSEAIDQEQHRLAQLLHDSVCQSLTGVQMLARVIARKLQTIAPAAAGEVGELDHLLQQAASELHELVHGLRLTEVAPDGLISALRTLAREISERIVCELKFPPTIEFADSYIPSQLFQSAQVAIRYALRRANVSRIVVSLVLEHGGLKLLISDDAPQSDRPDDRSVEGLFSWHVLLRRAEAIGASLKIKSSSTGTCVTCLMAQ